MASWRPSFFRLKYLESSGEPEHLLFLRTFLLHGLKRTVCEMQFLSLCQGAGSTLMGSEVSQIWMLGSKQYWHRTPNQGLGISRGTCMVTSPRKSFAFFWWCKPILSYGRKYFFKNKTKKQKTAESVAKWGKYLILAIHIFTNHRVFEYKLWEPFS